MYNTKVGNLDWICTVWFFTIVDIIFCMADIHYITKLEEKRF